MIEHPMTEAEAPVRFQRGTLFISLELSRSKWLVTADRM